MYPAEAEPLPPAAFQPVWPEDLSDPPPRSKTTGEGGGFLREVRSRKLLRPPPCSLPLPSFRQTSAARHDGALHIAS